MNVYLIKYISPAKGECYDSEMANNQIIAMQRFFARRPNVTTAWIKSKRAGIWMLNTGNEA